MNGTVKLLGGLSLFLVTAAIVLGRLGIKAGAGFIPVADPTDVMFGADEDPGGIWIGIAMILLLGGISSSIAAVRCWIQNRKDARGFAHHTTGLIPKQ